jgi:pimeloyl-ACP methyl ester carboxylesterase
MRKIGRFRYEARLLRPALSVILALLAAGATLASADDGIDLQDCRISAGPGYPGIKARCGILLRPLNPADPGSQLIDLNVAVVPALSLEPEPDPFVPIAGGPGQASTQFYAAQAAAFEDIRRKRDIVLVDQRGTGQSAAMHCDASDELTGTTVSDEQILAETRKCLDSLPYDSRYFTTSVAVQDLEALRTALGYTQFNVYGVSYGTRVAQQFARRYPQSVRSVILDGVVPPQLALGPAIASEAQRALNVIFDRCRESDACNARFPELASKFADLKARLATAPVEVTVSHPVTAHRETVRFGGNELAGAVRLLSYHPSTIALLPLLIHEAASGNLAPMAAQFLMSSESLSDALAIGMHNAVVCTEDVPFIEVAPAAREQLEQTYIGPVLLDTMRTSCSIWPAGVLDEDFKEPLATSLPVLLLSGDADPITPPAYAEQAAVDLQNARHLVGRHQGHGMAPRGCVPDIMADFVAAASVDDLDTDCLSRQFAMPFFLDFSGPSP